MNEYNKKFNNWLDLMVVINGYWVLCRNVGAKWLNDGELINLVMFSILNYNEIEMRSMIRDHTM